MVLSPEGPPRARPMFRSRFLRGVRSWTSRCVSAASRHLSAAAGAGVRGWDLSCQPEAAKPPGQNGVRMQGRADAALRRAC